MIPRDDPDRIQIAFDDHLLVANAGLIPPIALAHHLGLGELADRHVDLVDAQGREKRHAGLFPSQQHLSVTPEEAGDNHNRTD